MSRHLATLFFIVLALVTVSMEAFYVFSGATKTSTRAIVEFASFIAGYIVGLIVIWYILKKISSRR